MGVLPCGIRELPEGVSNVGVEIVTRPFHSVAFSARIRALEAVRCRYVEQEGEIGNEAGCGQPVGRAHLRLGESAADDLVGVRRQEETIDQDHFAGVERWLNLSRNQLGAGRHEQQCFTGRGYLVLAMKQYLTNRVPDRRATGLAYGYGGNSGDRQPFRQNPDLGRFSGALSSLEYDQPSARHSQDRVMIGLAAPFFMPSMIH
jgi:hypothetical protein